MPILGEWRTSRPSPLEVRGTTDGPFSKRIDGGSVESQRPESSEDEPSEAEVQELMDDDCECRDDPGCAVCGRRK